MNVTTKVSIVAGLVMAAIAPMSHAAPIDVYHQQINNIFAGDYFSGDRAWANSILNDLAGAVAKNQTNNINILTDGHYPNIQNASLDMRNQFTDILKAYVKQATDKPKPVTFSAGQSDGIAPLTAPDDTLSIPKSGKAAGYAAAHAVTQTITPPAPVSGAPFPVHPQNTAQTFSPSVTTAQPAPVAPAYIAPVATKTPAAPVINAPTAPDYAAIAAKAKDSAMSRANTIGGRATSKAYQQEPNLPATHTFTTLPAATPDPVPAAPVVYNSPSQKANDKSQAIANIQGGKRTAMITPPAYTAPVPPAPQPVAVAVPAAPVKVAPVKQTQGGGVWAKAPDIQGTNAGESTIVIRNQNMVQAPRPSTPMVVNPDVIGQPISTTTIAKTIALNPGQAPGGVAPVVDDSMPNLNTMDQGHNDPTGTPVETVTHKDYSNSTPAAQPGVQDTAAHSTTTIVNQVAPAVTVDKWGVDHTVETVDSSNVQNNATNAQDNATDKAAAAVVAPPAYTAPVPPVPATGAAPVTPAKPVVNVPAPKTAQAQPVNTAPAVVTPVSNPAPVQQQTLPPSQAKQNAAALAQYQQQTAAAWQAQQQLNSAFYDVAQAQQQEIAGNSAAISHNSQRIDNLEKQHKADRKDIQDNRKRAAAGVAGVAAMANIPQVTDSQSFAVGAGVGTYDSQNALAVGFSARINSHVVTKASVSAGNFGGVSAGAGVSIGW